LEQLEHDVLDVFAHVAGFGQGGGIGDGERHMEDARQGLGQERLAGACRADHQDIALLEIDVSEAVAIHDTLVMIVDRNRQHFLRALLSDHEFVERRFDPGGLGNFGGEGGDGVLPQPVV
jgi:hypothetical protein